MFGRYTYKARRVVLWGRYEASRHGVAEIDTRCLLLGMMREEKDLMSRLLHSGFAEAPGMLTASCEDLAKVAAEVEALFPGNTQRTPATGDMPLSQAARQALACAAEESERLEHKSIDGRHLLVGLLRANGPETACLSAHGIDLERVRREFASGIALYMPEGDQEAEWMRRYLEAFGTVQKKSADRREAAVTLVEGLASGKFEATGTSRIGPFHFSFEEPAE